jgi:hypothetical protein
MWLGAFCDMTAGCWLKVVALVHLTFDSQITKTSPVIGAKFTARVAVQILARRFFIAETT